MTNVLSMTDQTPDILVQASDRESWAPLSSEKKYDEVDANLLALKTATQELLQGNSFEAAIAVHIAVEALYQSHRTDFVERGKCRRVNEISRAFLSAGKAIAN